jgi:surface protein
MANNLDDALFWVQEGFGKNNNKYFVKGSDFADNAKGAEIVWVQRDDEKFWTYHSAPPDGATPDLTYRLIYTVYPVDTWQDIPRDQRTQPSGDGEINFSYYWGTPGPYPENEWKNIRNTNNKVTDLDGKELKLINNPDIEYGDIVRIRHEGGDFEAWYVIDNPDDRGGHVQFQVFNHSDNSKERVTHIKTSGTRPFPQKPGEGHVPILEFAVYKAVEPYNKIRDTDWVWAQKEDPVTGEYVKYKVKGQHFKALFNKREANFRVNSDTVKFNMKLHSGTANIMSMDNSTEYSVGTSYRNHTLGVGNWYIPMTEAGGCEHFTLRGSGSYITNHFQFLKTFNTSTVSNFSQVFKSLNYFNEDVSMFNTSNATNMVQMFYSCDYFNKPIDNFDTSNVTNFYYFMWDADRFNQSISNFDTSKGENFYRWFYSCNDFNQPINHLDFSSCPNFDPDNSGPSRDALFYAFGLCRKLNQDITGIKYNTSPYIVQTWAECSNMNHPGLESKVPFPPGARISGPSRAWTNCRISIANWTQPLPWSCDQLFSGWKYFNQSVDHLDFTNCTDFGSTFNNAQAFNHPSVANWDFSTAPKLKNVSYTFNGAISFDIEAINQWNMTNITSLTNMFRGSKAGTTNKGYFNLESWDVSNVISMANMFDSSNIVKGISTWNTSNLKVTCQMFQNSIVSDDLSGWDVSQMYRATNMFRNWGRIDAWRVRDWGYSEFDCNISNWNPRNVSEFKNAFLDINDPFSTNFNGGLSLWRWRMPKIEYSSSLSNSDWAAEDWRSEYSNSFFESTPSFNMKVIEPGYEPDVTIRTARLYESGTYTDIYVFGDVHMQEGVYEFINSSKPRGYTYRQDRVVDVFRNQSYTNGYLSFSGGSYSYNNRNWEFAESFGPHPELVNKLSNKFRKPFHDCRVSSSNISNVTGFENLDTSEVTNMAQFFEIGFADLSRSNFGKVNIEGWDVSNATTMSYFFGGKTTGNRTKVTAGDLRGWCVQGIPEKPNNWPRLREGFVEEDPLWGECPDPGEIPETRPALPDGDWMIYKNVLWIGCDDDINHTDNTINVMGQYSDVQMWARYRSDRNSDWSDWEFLGYRNGILPDFRIQYIVADNSPISFYGESGTNDIEFINVKFTNQTNMTWMLYNLRAFNSDISYWDVSSVNNMSNMFRNCHEFNQDISSWDTISLGNMCNMFNNCRKFNQDLSGWNTNNVYCSRNYDYGCTSWDLNYRPPNIYS